MGRAPVIKTLTAVAIALSAVALLSCTRNPDSGGVPRHDVPTGMLRDGDLVFRSGRSLGSDIVASVDTTPRAFTHVGIAINDRGTWKVIHAVPGEAGDDGIDRVKAESLDTFFLSTRATHGAVMRHRLCSPAMGATIARAALDKARRGVEFDDRYNWADTTRLYCTQLVHLAYRRAGLDLAAGRSTPIAFLNYKGNVVLPGDIARNDSLTTIYRF